MFIAGLIISFVAWITFGLVSTRKRRRSFKPHLDTDFDDQRLMEKPFREINCKIQLRLDSDITDI